MPLDRPGTLTGQEAWDVAAYVTSLPRTDLPGKELDYPGGNPPRDTPYRTRSGFVPAKTVPVYPRSRPNDALVPLSPTIRKR
jgi:cytochrome c